MKASVTTADVSLVRQGNDLLVELEHDDGFLIDTLTITDHFLDDGSGIEEIIFADGTVWGRDEIYALYRNDRFNAGDDLVRWGDEDVAYLITADRLIANDTETGDDALVITSVGNGQHGTATLNADGSVTFLGEDNYYGAAFFDYTVSDGRGRVSTATVEVTLRPVNDVPLACADGVFEGIEDTILEIPLADLLGNDFDADGDSLSIVALAPLTQADGRPITHSFWDMSGTYGNAKLVNNVVQFQPQRDFNGVAGFSYTVSDGHGGTASANVELYFTAVNDAPDVAEDTRTTRQERELVVSVASLLANDTDAENDPLTFVSAASPEHGSLVVEERMVNGVLSLVVVFIPEAGYLGEAGFNYSVADGRNGVGTGHVLISVIPLNDPPIVSGENFEGIEGQPLIIDPAELLANDHDPNGDTLMISRLDDYPENCTVRFTSDGKIEFVGKADYNGEASFHYWVSDGRGGEVQATASIWLSPVNTAPWISNDNVVTLGNTPVVLSAYELFANDGDAEGDVLHFARMEVMEGYQGSLRRDGDNYVLTLASNFVGQVVVRYQAVDIKDSVSDWATVMVTVQPASGLRIDGSDSDDILLGGDGNDTLWGGDGTDNYVVGAGMDVIDNVGHAADGDVVSFVDTTLTMDQLWFEQAGANLKVSILGSDSGVTIQDWYGDTANQVSAFNLGSGVTLAASQVENLVQAMSSFAPPPLGQTNLTSEQHLALDPVLAANWKAA